MDTGDLTQYLLGAALHPCPLTILPPKLVFIICIEIIFGIFGFVCPYFTPSFSGITFGFLCKSIIVIDCTNLLLYKIYLWDGGGREGEKMNGTEGESERGWEKC